MTAGNMAEDDGGWALSHTLPVMRFMGDRGTAEVAAVADEVPVALVYNDISHAVMLASPADLEDFAMGFSLTEGIVRESGEIYGCEPLESSEGIALRIHLAGERFAALKDRRRTLAGRSGCGLCGVDSLSAVVRPLRVVAPVDIRREAIARALSDFDAHQSLFSETGAVHAAAWVDLSGNVIAVREDVGRHNALDKLIGWRVRNNHAETGFIVVSSRASFEMVQKAAQAGVACLVAISAPTAMAVRLAEASNMLLAGFARDEMLTVYTHPQRLKAA